MSVLVDSWHLSQLLWPVFVAVVADIEGLIPSWIVVRWAGVNKTGV